MLLLGTKNTSTQTVVVDGLINIGSTYRKFCKKTCGIPAFSRTVNDISLNQQGIYHITATFVGTGTAAGDVTIQLLENGVVVEGAVATETITTATTEFRTFVIDYYILVDNDNVLGTCITTPKTITFENIGVEATFTSVVVNVTKEV